MGDPELKRIITLCLEIDELASKTYLQLSKNATGSLGKFWRTMSSEEESHVMLWRRLLTLTDDGMIPQVFDHPEKIVSELEAIKSKCGLVCTSTERADDVPKAFLLAFRLEFYLLHPAFAALFHFAGIFDNQINAEEKYDAHIDQFIETLNTHATVTPEFELLGETLHRLWHENRTLSIQSTMDDLTGVLNRRGFLNIVKPISHLAQRNNLTVALLMIDIDFFKKVNDAFGHKKGDEVLKKVAQILRMNLRASDVIGRYGGEEFIVFLSSATRETAWSLSETLRKKVEEESFADVSVTISIGISITRLDHNVDESVMRQISRADACMYEAKDKGRNKVVVCES